MKRFVVAGHELNDIQNTTPDIEWDALSNPGANSISFSFLLIATTKHVDHDESASKLRELQIKWTDQ